MPKLLESSSSRAIGTHRLEARWKVAAGQSGGSGERELPDRNLQWKAVQAADGQKRVTGRNAPTTFLSALPVSTDQEVQARGFGNQTLQPILLTNGGATQGGLWRGSLVGQVDDAGTVPKWGSWFLDTLRQGHQTICV